MGLVIGGNSCGHNVTTILQTLVERKIRRKALLRGVWLWMGLLFIVVHQFEPLCAPLTEHHDMKAYWGSGGTVPPIL
jgi:hypothetical protein